LIPSCRILQFLLLLLIWLPFSLQASDFQDNRIGHRLGVYFSEQEQASITSDQLSQLKDLGVSIIEIEGAAPPGWTDFVRNSDIYLLVRQNRAFVDTHELQTNHSLYIQQYISLIQFYLNEIGERAAAFGLFHYPYDKHSSGNRLLNLYVQEISAATGTDILLYYRSAYPDLEEYPGSFSFRSTRLTGRESGVLPTQAIHFAPADTTLGTIRDMISIFQRSLETEQSIILLPYSWLMDSISRFELLEETLKAYTREERVLIALPSIPEEPLSVNWVVVLVIVLLGSYAILYHKNPAYQKSLFRYFVMHKFFTEDLFEHRIRSSVPGTVLFFQHGILGGLCAFIVSSFYITQLGMEAMFHHFPVISLFGSEPYGFFIFGMIITLLIQAASIGWIQLLNKKTRLYQVATLYCWPLQINMVTVLLMTTMYLTASSGIWIAVFSILFVAIWFVGFNVAALGVARYLKNYRIIYIIFTVGIHVLLLSLFVAAVFFYPPLNEPIRLAISLP
jgi:hypothetical protein